MNPPLVKTPSYNLMINWARFSLPQSFSKLFKAFAKVRKLPEVYHDFGDGHYQQYAFKHIHISIFDP